MGSCVSRRIVSATRPGRSWADSRNLEAEEGSRWKRSIMAAATLCSSPGRQLLCVFASFSGSSQFLRCSSSFSPRVGLNWFDSSLSSFARPARSGRVRCVWRCRLNSTGRRLCCSKSLGRACLSTTVLRPSYAAFTAPSERFVRYLKNTEMIRERSSSWSSWHISAIPTAFPRTLKHSSRRRAAAWIPRFGLFSAGRRLSSSSAILTTSCKNDTTSGARVFSRGGSRETHRRTAIMHSICDSKDLDVSGRPNRDL